MLAINLLCFKVRQNTDVVTANPEDGSSKFPLRTEIICLPVMIMFENPLFS